MIVRKLNSVTYWARIYIAGSKQTAEEICREFCYDIGLCVNVVETNYIYTAGEQKGVIVELINYPKFPSRDIDIKIKAKALGNKLVNGMKQKSYTIEFPNDTIYFEKDDFKESGK